MEKDTKFIVRTPDCKTFVVGIPKQGSPFIQNNNHDLPSYEDCLLIKDLIEHIIEGKENNIQKKKEEQITYDIEETEENFGYVYFIKCRELYKIGSTRNPSQRLKTHSTSCPFKQEVLFCRRIKNYEEVESFIINKLDERIRAGQEWFELSEKEARKVIKFLQKKAEEIEIE